MESHYINTAPKIEHMRMTPYATQTVRSIICFYRVISLVIYQFVPLPLLISHRQNVWNIFGTIFRKYVFTSCCAGFCWRHIIVLIFSGIQTLPCNLKRNLTLLRDLDTKAFGIASAFVVYTMVFLMQFFIIIIIIW